MSADRSAPMGGGPVGSPARCACGNAAAEGEPLCQWCTEADCAKNSQTVPHTWQTSRFTETTTCSECGLLPIDPTDSYSDCPARR